MSEVENPVQKLWQDQPVEGITMSVEEIQRRAGKFEHRIWWRNAREYVGSLIAVGLFMYFFVSIPDVLSRVTFALFIAGMVWIVVQLHRQGSATLIPAGLDAVTSLRLYRAELERQRAAVANVWWWYLAPLVPGFVVHTIGYAVKFQRPAAWAGLALVDAIVVAMFVVIWKMNMRAARCLGKMIEELNGVE